MRISLRGKGSSGNYWDRPKFCPCRGNAAKITKGCNLRMLFRRGTVSGALALALAVESAFSAPAGTGEAARQPEQSAPALIQMRIIEGDGAVHTIGTRSSQPLVLFLSDESGRAVIGASVAARLPDEGPSGTFLNGLRSEIAITGPDGRVAIRGIQWGRLPGSVQIRITASMRDARAGIVSTQYVSEPAGSFPKRTADSGSPARPPARMEPPSRSKWLLFATLVGAAAAGGVVAAANSGGRSAPNAPPASSQPPISIGNPSISIGSRP